jgi:hypothetical protein
MTEEYDEQRSDDAPAEPADESTADASVETPVVVDDRVPTSTADMCANCRKHVGISYYDVNGSVLCKKCTDEYRASLTGGSNTGSYVASLIAGIFAGAAGTALYLGVTESTGYDWGLLVIAVVGLLVGGAVRLGARGRGGAYYQAIGMILTYLAIGAAFSVTEIQKKIEEGFFDQPTAAETRTAEPPTASTEERATEPEPEPVAFDEPSFYAADEPAPGYDEAAGGSSDLSAYLVLLALPFVMPAINAVNQPISGLLAAIAILGAWRLNRRRHTYIDGPFLVGSGPASSRRA